MTDSLLWNWALPLPDRVPLFEKLLKSIESALANDPMKEVLQLRVLEARIAAKKYEAAIELGNRRPPGLASSSFSSAAWDWSLANALYTLDHYDECVERIDAVLAIEDDPGLRIMRMNALVLAKRHDEAASDLAMQRSDPDPFLTGPILNLALSEWGAKEILSCLDRRPATFLPGEEKATRIRCLLKLGRADEIAAMVDLDRHVKESIMNTPVGWRSIDFLEALRTEIRNSVGFVQDPGGYATVGGEQSFRILENRPKAIDALIGQIRCEAERYCASLPDGDPVKSSRPVSPNISAWAVNLDQGGYQKSHLHPAGWLSGVYYVATPNTDSDAGALSIGLPFASGEALPWSVRHILSEPGKLVLFPSFLRHETSPHRGPHPRISIAFDIVPDQADKA